MPIMTGFHALKNLPEEKVTDKITRRVLIGEKEMIVWWSMQAGAERRMCSPGDLGVIPGGVEHEEDTDVIDVFAPPREDFMPGAAAPAYMQKG
jgi:hypothetical protein